MYPQRPFAFANNVSIHLRGGIRREACKRGATNDELCSEMVGALSESTNQSVSRVIGSSTPIKMTCDDRM